VEGLGERTPRRMTQVSLGNAGVQFGASTIFTGVTLTIAAGDRWGVIGRNGTGKTTLFKLLIGELKPTTGTVARAPGLTLTLLEQHREFPGARTIWEAAAGPFASLIELERSLAEQATALASDSSDAAMDRYARDLEAFERGGGYTYAPRVDAILQGLGFDPEAARTREVRELSGGERGRLGVARQLASTADILLLDEPTNHLDLETTAWLEEHLRAIDRTVVVISHDRAFLAALVDHVLHFEGGTAEAYRGDYQSFVQQRSERQLSQQRAFDRQQRVISAEKDYIARNIAGVNSAQAKGRRKRLDRMPRLSAPTQEQGAMAVAFSAGDRGGDQVAVADRLTIRMGERTLVSDFSARLMRGDRVGLIGANGAGKSTLLRTLMGELPPSGGEVRLGAGIDAAYYRQDLAQLPMDGVIYDVISDMRPTWERRHVQGHLGRFGFSGDEVGRRIATLSGGERARVALAVLTLARPNLLVLDEPTNHLDVESIEALEDALSDYEGTLLLVSHDRALLRALVTRVWVLHEGHITDFDGTFPEWEVASSERAHAATVKASEAEALRRVKEKQRTGRGPARPDARSEIKRLSRDVETALASVERFEATVRDLTRALEDPELYMTAEGVKRGHELGGRLDDAKRELDAALERWAELTAALEELDPAGRG
jgi:ATP-binding cassette, subfamily F, member 3